MSRVAKWAPRWPNARWTSFLPQFFVAIMHGHSSIGRRFQWLGDAIITACNGAFAAIEWAFRILGREPVENITTEQLHRELLSRDSGIVLIDVRSEEEQRVSVIPGAIPVQAFEAQPDAHVAKTVVTYCTVGGRSYLYARKLCSRGISARNYRDSILGWVHAGHSLQSLDGKPSRRIHPYWRIFRVPDEYEVEL